MREELLADPFYGWFLRKTGRRLASVLAWLQGVLGMYVLWLGFNFFRDAEYNLMRDGEGALSLETKFWLVLVLALSAVSLASIYGLLAGRRWVLLVLGLSQAGLSAAIMMASKEVGFLFLPTLVAAGVVVMSLLKWRDKRGVIGL